jgi:hypothetical protein
MEILEGENLRRRLLESYSKNPEGWSFVVSPSMKHRFYDATVSGPDGTWMLKIDSVFKPLPVVLGSLTEANTRLNPTDFVPYGYRKLPPELILQMLRSESHPPSGRTAADLLSVIRSNPVIPEERGSYAEGPFIFANARRGGLSESQEELDDKLASEMHRLLRIRYPAYG